jgi:hypothetical protein
MEWVDTDPPVPAPRRTDIAAFVGSAVRGPVHEPVRLRSWSPFERVFGGHSAVGWLAHAVNGFFTNGGDTCWVVRVADPVTMRASRATLPTTWGAAAMSVTATSPGTWADGTKLTTQVDGGVLGLAVDGPLGRETWLDLSLDPASPRFALTLLNDARRGSAAIRVEEPVPRGARVATGSAVLGGGGDGLTTLTSDHLLGVPGDPDKAWGLAAVDQIDEVAVVVVPDALARPAAGGGETASGETPPQWSADATARMQAAVLDRAAARRRFAVLDVRSRDVQPDAALAWAERLREHSASTAFGCLGYPWVVVVDPRGPDRGTLAVPLGGHLAGIIARSDRSVGVHKAPANETVTGAVDTAQPVLVDTHERLNDLGVSAVVARPGRGIRMLGARTLSLDATWRFTNVRRLVSMIESSLESALSWLVFEPHNTDLTGIVEREVRTFLTGLYDRGALDGARPEQAFAVRCDATTMTEQDVDAGRLICLVELRPPVPAEIVLVRLAVTEGGVQVSGEQGRQIPSVTGVIDAR